MQSYYLLGSPIAHSFSPAMMNYSFEALGIDAKYELRETTEDTITDVVRALCREEAAGWNVTMPVKASMARLCDELSDAARIGGAVNTVKHENGRLIGHTTDGIGFLRAMRDADCPLPGKKMTLLGSGGAAASILIQSALDGASDIAVFCRPGSSRRIRRVAEELRAHSATKISICSYDEPKLLRAHLQESAALVNATNVGMAGGPSPEGCLIPEPSFLPEDLFVYDVVYHPLKTPLLQMAEGRGCRCLDGVTMLIGQGAASFQIWTGAEMPVSGVTRLLRARIEND